MYKTTDLKEAEKLQQEGFILMHITTKKRNPQPSPGQRMVKEYAFDMIDSKETKKKETKKK